MEPSYYTNPEKASCIDHILINSPNRFFKALTGLTVVTFRFLLTGFISLFKVHF